MNRTHRIVTAAAIAGGTAWIAKFLVIAATDGAVDDEGAAAVFYLLGLALMAIGAAAITLRLIPWRPIAALLAPVLFVLSFMLLDGIAKPLVGDAGPSWLEDEAGIVLTGVVWLAVGLGLLRSIPPRRPVSA